jgi:hypothetical protein
MRLSVCLGAREFAPHKLVRRSLNRVTLSGYNAVSIGYIGLGNSTRRRSGPGQTDRERQHT